MKFGRKKDKNADDAVVAPSDIVEDINIEAAAQDVQDVLSTMPPVTEQPTKAEVSIPKPPQMPDVDIEDALISTFKTTKGAVDAVKKFEEENKVTEKAKEAWEKAEVADKLTTGWNAAVNFWKDNEIGLKLTAVAELGMEAAKKVEMPKAAAPKAAASKKVAKKTGSKTTAKKGKRGFF